MYVYSAPFYIYFTTRDSPSGKICGEKLIFVLRNLENYCTNNCKNDNQNLYILLMYSHN